MKKLLLFILTVVVMGDWLSAQINQRPVYIENELYVKLKASNVQNAVQYIPYPGNPDAGKTVWELIKSFGGINMINTFPGSTGDLRFVYRVKLKPGSDIDGLVKMLNKSPDVEYGERIPYMYMNFVPDDYDNDKQWCFRVIKMSWNGYQPRIGYEINIAVVDDGVRYTHEDLRNKLMWSEEVDGGFDGIDNDGNGIVDDVYGYDVSDNDNNPIPPTVIDASNGIFGGCHGTHVAGIIAGDPNNGVGITSLGVNNRILPVKAASDFEVLNNSFTLDRYAEGVSYAIKKGVDIINCSWGSYTDSKTLRLAIDEALANNIIIVAGAGNHYKTDPFYPAAYNGVIAVGATDQSDHIFHSNYGSYIDVMAPGKDILSTIAENDHSYAVMSGTSMAAPLVSSLIGLTLSLNPDLRNDIEKALKVNCDNIDDLNVPFAGRMGAGRINVDNTLNYSGDLTTVGKVAAYGDFNVYPNPASSSVSLPFSQISNGQPLTYTVMNSSGIEVSRFEISQDRQAVDISQYPAGIYYVTTTASGKYYKTRLLVSR